MLDTGDSHGQIDVAHRCGKAGRPQLGMSLLRLMSSCRTRQIWRSGRHVRQETASLSVYYLGRSSLLVHSIL